MRQNTNIVSAYFDLADHLNFFCVLNRIKKKIHDQKIQLCFFVVSTKEKDRPHRHHNDSQSLSTFHSWSMLF